MRQSSLFAPVGRCVRSELLGKLVEAIIHDENSPPQALRCRMVHGTIRPSKYNLRVKSVRCSDAAVDLRWLVDALEAVDELLGEGFAGFGPEETAADAAVLFDREGERQEHLDVLLNVLRGGFVELLIFEGLGKPGCVEAEVDADVAVLFEAGVVELGA